MEFQSPPAMAGGTSNGGGVPNYTRLELYYEMACTILMNVQHTETVANLMVDVRFSEIPQAFAKAISAYAKGDEVVRAAGLAERFAILMEHVTFVAFGTTEREAVPSWFFQNYEGFLAACMHKLLVQYSTMFVVRSARMDDEGRRALVREAGRAFEMVFELCAGAKNYLSLDCLVHSTKAHAVLAVCNHSRYDFLHVSKASHAHVEFMNLLSMHVLNDATPAQRDVTDVRTSFGYFAGTRMWRNFASSCAWRNLAVHDRLKVADGKENWTLKLEQAVRDAYAALQSECSQSMDAMLNRKRVRKENDDDVVSGTDDADNADDAGTTTPERPSTPTNFATTARYAHALVTPPEKRRAVPTAQTANDPAFRKLVEERIGLA